MSCSFGLRGRLLTGALLEALKVLSGRGGRPPPSLCSPSHPRQLTGLFREGVPTPVWYPDVCSCYQGTPLHHSSPVTSWVYAGGSHGRRSPETATTLRAQPEATEPGAQFFSERGLSAYRQSCSLKGRLLIQHLSKG